MVISRAQRPNGVALIFVTARLNFIIEESALRSTPLCFKHWILMRIFLSKTLASIWGNDCSWEDPLSSSSKGS